MLTDKTDIDTVYVSVAVQGVVTARAVTTQSWSNKDGILQSILLRFALFLPSNFLIDGTGGKKTVETKPKVSLQCEKRQTSFISAAVCAVVPMWKFVD